MAAPPQIKLDAPEELRDDLISGSLLYGLGADDEGDAVRASDVLAAAQADYARLLAVMYEAARYDAVISIRLDGREAANISRLSLPPVVAGAQIRVDPGPEFTFRRAVVQPLPPQAEPADGFSPGDPAGTVVMRRAVEKGVADWRGAGHAKARAVQQQITADHSNSRIDAEFTLRPGPRLRFGALRVDGSSAVRQSRLRKIAGLPVGAQFSPAEIELASERLLRSGAFSVVRLTEAEEPSPDGTLDTNLLVEDAKPRRIGFGAEVSSTEGLSISGFWMHRNLSGAADRLRFSAEISGIGGDSGGMDYDVGVAYSFPAIYGPDASLTVYGQILSVDEPTYSADIGRIGADVIWTLTKRLSARSGAGFRAARSDDPVFGARDFDHLTLSGGLTWDSRDDRAAATRGLYADIGALGFVGINGSQTGAQIKADLRGYRKLDAAARTVIALRAQAGVVLGTSIAQTPPGLLFLSGGGGTVRGQGYQSLGVTFPAGTLGGRGFVGVSAELRQRITERIGIVGFADYGYVSESADLSGGDSHAGIGIGARYFTPIGPIRLDLAVPADGLDDYGVYIGIGHAF